MALTPNLITRNTAVAAVACVVALLGSIWAIVEFAPQRDMAWVDIPPEQAPVFEKSAPHHALDVPFDPATAPEDPRICAFTSDNIFERFEHLAQGDRPAFHTRGIAGLVEAYIDLGCPAAIHQGDWHTTAQILRVALVYEALRPQADVYDASVEWDPRAAELLGVATSTYDVLAPSRMCKQALGMDGAEPHAVPTFADGLYPTCIHAFRQ